VAAYVRGKGLSKNRRDDGTGRSIPPAAGDSIVALMNDKTGRMTGQQLLPNNESLVVSATGQT